MFLLLFFLLIAIHFPCFVVCFSFSFACLLFDIIKKNNNNNLIQASNPFFIANSNMLNSVCFGKKRMCKGNEVSCTPKTQRRNSH